jgi:hypothetical protein
MKTQKDGLQKFTELEIKIAALMQFKQLKYENLEILTSAEKGEFERLMTIKLNLLRGDERDAFLKKIDLITTQNTKYQIWEDHHINITSTISKYIHEYGCMPTKSHLAEKTGLSRQTIHKHIKDYHANSQYVEEIEQFKFMTSKLLAKVFKYATNGDMRAAKLYFDMVGNMQNDQVGNTYIKNQNNYIQINGTILSQDRIKQLSKNQLEQIEQIISFGTEN